DHRRRPAVPLEEDSVGDRRRAARASIANAYHHHLGLGAQLVDQLGGRRLGEDLLAAQRRRAGAIALLEHVGHVLEEAPRVLLAVLEQADLHAAQLGGAGRERHGLGGGALGQSGGVKNRAGHGEVSLGVWQITGAIRRLSTNRSV